MTTNEVDCISLTVRNIRAACHIRAKNIRHFLNVIRCINFTNNTEIQFSAAGMTYCGEESQYFQGTLFLKVGFFDHFKYVPSSISKIHIGLNLSKFTEFLAAFIDNDLAFLKIVCYGENRPLAFILSQKDSYQQKPFLLNGQDDEDINALLKDDDNTNDSTRDINAPGIEIRTEYVVQTKETINPVEYLNMQTTVLSVLVIEAGRLLEFLQELDQTLEEIHISIKDAHVSFRTVGTIQCSSTIKLKFATGFFIQHSVQKSSKYNYKYTCFKTMLKSMPLASKICLETLSNGVLRSQLMIPTADAENEVFLEFHMAPSIMQEEDNDNNKENDDREQ